MNPPSDPSRLDPAALLAHGEFVRALAGRLVRDPSRAEDVAQETWRAALERPPREAKAAWFAKVTRAFAAREFRGEQRRARRERAAARDEALPDVVETVASLEWSRLLARTVQSLPERERDVVVRRYWHGWSVARIAGAEGVARRTVETRLQKAYERLRTRLAERGERRGSWVAGLDAVAGLSARPMRWATLAGAVGQGVIAMKLWLMGAGVLAVGVLAWNAMSDEPEPAAPPRAEAAAAGPEVAEARPIVPRRAESAATGEPVAEEEVTAPALSVEPTRRELADWRVTTAPGELAGIVLRRREPVAGAEVFFKLDAGFAKLERPWTDHPDTRRLTTGGDGRFSVAGLEAGDYAVGVRRPGGALREAWVAVDTQQPGRSLVLVLGGASLSGTAYDAKGRPRQGSLVALGLRNQREAQVGSDDFHLFALTDADGRYRLEDLPAGSYWMSHEPGGRHRYWYSEETETISLRLALDESRVHDLGEPRPRPDIEGRVVDRGGRSIEGPGSLLLVPEGGGYQRAALEQDGTFRVRLTPGRYRVHLTMDDGELPLVDAQLAVAEATREARLCVAGTRVLGQLVFDDGRPWPEGVRAQVFGRWESDAAPGDQRDRRLQTDPTGRFALEGLGPGTWTFGSHPYTLVEGQSERTVILRADELERIVVLRVQIPR